MVDRSAMYQLGTTVRFSILGSLCGLAFALGCQKTTPEPESTGATEPKAESAPQAVASESAPVMPAATTAPPAAAPAPKPIASVPVSPDDPLAGKFTLEDATKGLTGTGGLYAEIQTELGKLECELYEDK